jgi:hypothetical protein
MAGKRKALRAADQNARWQAMVEEAIVDCYNENEELASILATLKDRLEFLFQARVLGETVEVIGLDQEQSSKQRGVVAKVRKGGRQYTVALADL